MEKNEEHCYYMSLRDVERLCEENSFVWPLNYYSEKVELKDYAVHELIDGEIYIIVGNRFLTVFNQVEHKLAKFEK